MKIIFLDEANGLKEELEISNEELQTIEKLDASIIKISRALVDIISKQGVLVPTLKVKNDNPRSDS